MHEEDNIKKHKLATKQTLMNIENVEPCGRKLCKLFERYIIPSPL